MTTKVLYWDNELKQQLERDASPAEEAEVLARRTLSVDQKKAAKLAALADYRYSKETGGIALGGEVLETDRMTVAQLTSAVALMQVDPSATVDWKRLDGTWVTHNRASLNMALVAIGTHVRTCFTREKFHAEQIAALNTGPQVDAYDFTTGWPA